MMQEAASGFARLGRLRLFWGEGVEAFLGFGILGIFGLGDVRF